MEVLLTLENSIIELLTPMAAPGFTWYSIEYDWKIEFKDLFHHCIEFNRVPCKIISFNGILSHKWEFSGAPSDYTGCHGSQCYFKGIT